jgi:hypothetical protein
MHAYAFLRMHIVARGCVILILHACVCAHVRVTTKACGSEWQHFYVCVHACMQGSVTV